MNTSLVFQIAAILSLLALSGFFSSAETALTTVNPHSVSVLAEEGDKRARTLCRLIENPGQMLSGILIGNNLVNISLTSLSTSIAIEIFGNIGAGIAAGILTLLILLFGEITPKTFASVYNLRLALAYAPAISLMLRILSPLIVLIHKISRALLRLMKMDPDYTNQVMTEREIRTIVHAGYENGAIEEEEKEMLDNVFDFKNLTARDIMLPKVDISFVSLDASYDEVVNTFLQSGRSRLPVFRDTKDTVAGILYLKDLYFYCIRHETAGFCPKEIMRPAFFTYETQKVSDLLLQMKEQSLSFAIVLDEYGEAAGLITLEDIVEEIFGDIRDEYDSKKKAPFQKTKEGACLVSASMKLDDINSLLHLDLHSRDYESIGGYMIQLLGHLPKEGEQAQDHQAVFQVISAVGNRIRKIKITPFKQLNKKR